MKGTCIYEGEIVFMKGTCIYEGVFMKRIIPNPKSGIQNQKKSNPKSQIQTFWPDFGFWILDRYVPVLLVRPLRARILDFGFLILDLGFWILEFGTNFGSYIR